MDKHVIVPLSREEIEEIRAVSDSILFDSPGLDPIRSPFVRRVIKRVLHCISNVEADLSLSMESK